MLACVNRQKSCTLFFWIFNVFVHSLIYHAFFWIMCSSGDDWWTIQWLLNHCYKQIYEGHCHDEMMGQSTAFCLQLTKPFFYGQKGKNHSRHRFYLAKTGKTTAVTVFIWPKREKPHPSRWVDGCFHLKCWTSFHCGCHPSILVAKLCGKDTGFGKWVKWVIVTERNR